MDSGYAMDAGSIVGILVVVSVVGWLATQRWFWLTAFGLAGLASAFSTLASIFHFQIMAAMLFFFLTILCWGVAVFIIDTAPWAQ